MNESIRFGSVRGIKVGAHWSVLVIGWLLVWALAESTFPTEAPGSPVVLYWLTAAVAVCLFWAGLLAHELAHSLVATRLGVEVDGITLWLFGGMSRLRGEATTPDAELRIAAAGPATSVVIALVYGGLAGGFAALGGLDLLVAALAWLAVINGLLAAFNLVPAAPLDGGRVLHAFVWRKTGDRSHATVVATNAGRTFGYALTGIGIFLLAAGNLGGMWFAFLGWFLLNAARAEATHLLIHDALAGIRVRDVMTPEPITVPADLPVAELLEEHVMRHHCSAFPVVDDAGAVVGLITLQQLKTVLPDRRPELHTSDVAWPLDSVPTGAPNEPVLELIGRLAGTTAGDGRALVFEHGRLVGIVSPTDISRAIDLACLRDTRLPSRLAAPSTAGAPPAKGTTR